MGWVSPKVYAILSHDEKGKDILEGIADKDQDQVDKEVDAFFANKGANKEEELKAPLSDEQKKTVKQKTKLIWGGTRGHKADPELEQKIQKTFDSMTDEYSGLITKSMDEGYVRSIYQQQSEGFYTSIENKIVLDRYDLTENSVYVEMGVLVHECGHSVDNMLGDQLFKEQHNYDSGKYGRWVSSQYISEKYGMSLAEMVTQEAKGYTDEDIKNIFEEESQNVDSTASKIKANAEEYEKTRQEWNVVKDIYVAKRSEILTKKFGEHSAVDWKYKEKVRKELIEQKCGSIDDYWKLTWKEQGEIEDEITPTIEQKMKEYFDFTSKIEEQDEEMKEVSEKYNSLRTKMTDLSKQGQSLKNKKYRDWGDVCDLIGGANCQKGVADLMFGHESSYWGNDGSGKQKSQLGKECFAELYQGATVNQTSYFNMKRMFPKTVEIFEEIMRKYGK